MSRRLRWSGWTCTPRSWSSHATSCSRRPGPRIGVEQPLQASRCAAVTVGGRPGRAGRAGQRSPPPGTPYVLAHRLLVRPRWRRCADRPPGVRQANHLQASRARGDARRGASAQLLVLAGVKATRIMAGYLLAPHSTCCRVPALPMPGVTEIARTRHAASAMVSRWRRKGALPRGSAARSFRPLPGASIRERASSPLLPGRAVAWRAGRTEVAFKIESAV